MFCDKVCSFFCYVIINLFLPIYLQLFFGGLPSSNVSMPLREIEAKLFALNAVSTLDLFSPGQVVSF